MQAKKNLAHSITADFHSPAEATAAAENWSTQFQQKGVAEDLPEVKVAKDAENLMHISDAETLSHSVRMARLLVLAGLAPSAGEATRKLNENAVSINGEKRNDRFLSLDTMGDSPVLRLGKKSVRIKWTE